MIPLIVLPAQIEPVAEEGVEGISGDAGMTHPALYGNSAEIRKLLVDALSDEELTALCYDHFRPVYDKFGDGVSRLRKIQWLIEYCERHRQIEKLLDLVRESNPVQYDRFRERVAAAS